jgi:hypothetical protein
MGVNRKTNLLPSIFRDGQKSGYTRLPAVKEEGALELPGDICSPTGQPQAWKIFPWIVTLILACTNVFLLAHCSMYHDLHASKNSIDGFAAGFKTDFG